MRKIIFGMFAFCALSLYANPTKWNNPILVSAKSGYDYDIKYTTTEMSHVDNSGWMKVNFDDSEWSSCKGPLRDNDGLGTKVSGENISRYVRRSFTLDHAITGDVYMACGHDDEGAIWIDGTKIIEWGNVWDANLVQKLTEEQVSLLTAGDHVIAIWAKNNSGGYYWDCGLYADDVTFTATGQSVGDASKLFDGNWSDGSKKWEGDATDGNGKYKKQYALFETDKQIYVNGITLYTANDNENNKGRSPRRWRLCGSNDESAKNDANHDSWSIIHEVFSVMPEENAIPVEFPFNPSQTAYQYFKFEVDHLGGSAWMQVGEMQIDFSTEPLAQAKAIAWSAAMKDDENGEKLFDGKNTSKWCCNHNGDAWIVFKTPKPIYATKYILQTANDANSRDPKTFKLYGAMTEVSKNGTTDGWKLLDEKEDASRLILTDRYAQIDFDIQNPGIYQYFMLKVEGVRGETETLFQLSEFVVDGETISPTLTFEINNDDDMATFADLVNVGFTNIIGDLKANVNSSKSIGTDTYKYKNTFKGNGHKVNLNINANAYGQGFIGVAEGGVTIKDLVLTGSVTNTGSKTGGFIAEAQVGGTVKIVNCGNEATIKGAGGEVAAIVANNWGYRCTLDIENVYNIGDVSGTSDVASICACQGNSNSKFINVYNSGNITGAKQGYFVRTNPGTYTNCFSTIRDNNDNANVVAITSDQVASGELCVALGSAFTQDLSTEGYPTFGSKAVAAGKWFNDANNDVYYNQEGENYTVYQLNLNEENKKYDVPANVTAKNVKMTRKIGIDKWNTFVSPVAIDKYVFSEVKELTGVTVNGDNYSMTFTTADEIVPGKPYMVKVDEDVTELTANNVTLAAVNPTEINGLTFTGVYKKGNAPYDSFIISNNMFYLVDSDVTVKAFRGYITTGSQTKVLTFTFDEDETAITEMEDGTLKVEGRIYNLAGHQLPQMQKGVNIINGKKVLK